MIMALIIGASTAAAQDANPNYDPDLAAKLGADDYGMKNFVMVVLKTGPANITDPAERAEKFKGHFANIKRLVEEKKLVIAGPFGKNEDAFRGLFIMNVKTVDDAKILLKDDPTIASGVFEAVYYSWYGSAALGEYLEASDKIWKVKP